MVSASSPEVPTSTYRPASAWWLAGVSWLLALAGMTLAIAQMGPRALLDGWPFYVVAFLGWWLFYYPKVTISSVGISVHNPVRTISIPWGALSNIETKFALTLIAGDRRFGVWAAPAGGAFSSRRGGKDSMPPGQDLESGMRASELLNSPSGGVAHMIRREWQRLIESGELGKTQEVSVRINVAPLAGALALLVFAVVVSTRIFA